MNTWEIVIGMLTMLGLGGIINKQWSKWFPSKGDLTSTIKSAIDIHGQLNHQVAELVEEKTQVLQNIIMRREGEFHMQIKEYAKQIFSLQEALRASQEEIKALRTENADYQKQILNCYKDLTDERRLKEQYYEALQDAKEHITELEKRVDELERINNK